MKRNTCYGYTICPSDSMFQKYKGKTDWTRSKLKNFLREIALKFEKEEFNFDGIIFAITGHGCRDAILTHKAKSYRCHDMHNKICNKKNKMETIPKIFFIDACRDDKGKCTCFDPIFQSIIDEQNKNSIHNLLVTVYGNSFGKQTFADEDDGSNFIFALCKILKKNLKENKNWNLSKITCHTKSELKKISDGTQLVDKCGDPEMDFVTFRPKHVQNSLLNSSISLKNEKKEEEKKMDNNEMHNKLATKLEIFKKKNMKIEEEKTVEKKKNLRSSVFGTVKHHMAKFIIRTKEQMHVGNVSQDIEDKNKFIV